MPSAADIRIERGAPTDEEVAAVVVALAVRATQPHRAPEPPAGRWAMSARPGYAHRDGRPSRPSRDAWRTAALPR